MLTLILFFLLISSGGVFYAAFFGKRYEETLPITCISLILLLFVCGLCGVLHLGVYLALLLGLAAYLAAFARVLQSHGAKVFFSSLFTPAFFIFIALYVAVIVFNTGKLCDTWDEFSHWGDIVKIMVSSGKFGTAEGSGSSYPSYPPGVSLFQYLLQMVNRIAGDPVFCEWQLYVAYQVLAFALLMPFLRWLQFRSPLPWVVCTAALVLFPMFLYENYYRVIYVDAILGIMAASGTAMIFTYRNKDGFYWATVLLTCSLLTLSKDVGLLLSVCLGVLVIADAALQAKLDARAQGRHMQVDHSFVLRFVFAVLAVFLPKVLWSLQVALSKTYVMFSGKFDFADFVAIVAGKETDSYRVEVLQSFIAKMQEQGIPLWNIPFSASYVMLFGAFLVLLLAVFFVFNKADPDRKKVRIQICLIVILEVVVYTVGMCLSYMYKFEDWEALKLASFYRYMNIIFLMFWGLIVICGAVLVQRLPKLRLVISVLLLALVAGVTNYEELEDFYDQTSIRYSLSVRSAYQGTTQNIADFVGENNPRIFFINQGSNGYDYYVLKFSLHGQAKLDKRCWSLVLPAESGDYFSNDIACADWQNELLAHYDYVLVYHADSAFVQNCGAAFADSISDGVLYRVDKSSGMLYYAQYVRQ